MKSWPSTLKLQAPVRDVVVGGGSAIPPARPGLTEADLKAAFERGRAEGEKALSSQLVQQRTEVQQLVQGVVESLRRSADQVVRDSEQHLVALALEIAEKVVGEVPISVEMIEAAVRASLAEIEGATEFHVRLHPSDMDLLEKMGSSVLTRSAEEQKVCFSRSPEVTRGGCLVQTRFGVIDARRETKMDLLKRSLLG